MTKKRKMRRKTFPRLLEKVIEVNKREEVREKVISKKSLKNGKQSAR